MAAKPPKSDPVQDAPQVTGPQRAAAGLPAIGQTLSAFDLRGRTRALIIAVVREGKHHVSPDPDFVLREADILVLVGDHQSLEAAFEVLSAP